MSGELSVSVSQRDDNLSWNIAGSAVNILSELKWENMSIAQFQVSGEIRLGNESRVRAKLGYGMVNSGTNQDSDYNGNNRTMEFSRSISTAGGDVLDASIGLGKKLNLRELSKGNSIHVTPLVGLSIHQQNLTMTDGVQIISAAPSTTPLGPFPGLDSSYDARWIGPWLGAEALIETERGWSMMANVEYHLVDYSASANWNLRADLAHPVSFKHVATGDGIVMSLGVSYPVNKSWKMDLILERQNWSTQAGNDQVIMADGTVGNTRLNAVNWDSTAYYFGIIREF
ncbi:MAG: hypothetical protein WA635_14560 [Gallionella sp.]